MKRIAVIGSGNMGSAVIASLAGDTRYSIVATAHTEATLHHIRTEYKGVVTTTDNIAAVRGADIVVLAVKPYIAAGVVADIRSHVKSGCIVISVVAGVTVAELQTGFGNGTLHCFRVIPNTAIRCSKSVTFISHAVDEDETAVDEVKEIFDRSGRTFIVAEKDMGVCTALASCGIAYFMRFIRALAEGAVEMGLRPAYATAIAALTAGGAAALLEEGGHPEVEIDKVTTPGGITIKGLNALEENGFTAAVIAAVKASSIK